MSLRVNAVVVCVALLGIAALPRAARSAAPIVVQFPATMQARGGGAAPGLAYAVIGAWANAAADRQSAAQIEAFRERTGGIDFPGAVRDRLRCVGTPEPRTACRDLLTLPSAQDERELAAALAAAGTTQFMRVSVVPLLSDERFRVRAFVSEMAVTPKGLRTTRAYGAIYDSRAPQELVAAADTARLRDYWAEGTPPRIEREALDAAGEIERALSFLAGKLDAGAGKPEFAKSLPSLDALRDAGRVACRGMPCAQVRVIGDFGPRLWLTSTASFGAYGPVIASLDANSAAHSSNLFILVITLE